MKKKILSLLLVLVLAFSSLLFVACGQRQVVTENPVVSEAHNEEPAPAEQAADAVTAAPATDGYIKFGKGTDIGETAGDSYTYDGTTYKTSLSSGLNNYSVTQTGNSVVLTGTVKGHTNDVTLRTPLSNSSSLYSYEYHHFVVLSLTSEYRVRDDNAQIANVAFWTPILDEDGNPTSNYGFNDGDDDYAPVAADYTAGILTINTDKLTSLKIKVTFNDENETEKEYTIDLSQLRGANGDNITKAEKDATLDFAAYDDEDEIYVLTQDLASTAYDVNQYNKEFVISGTLPYYQKVSTEFGAGYIVVLKINSAERLAANAKSVYSVSGGDAKLYSNKDYDRLSRLVYGQLEEEDYSAPGYENYYFYLVWRMDKGNTAPLTLKVTWADYAVEQTYTISLASDVTYEEHDDGITKIEVANNGQAEPTYHNNFYSLKGYENGANVLGASSNYVYAAPENGTVANIGVKQYDTAVSLLDNRDAAVHYSVVKGEAVGYGYQLTFTYIENAEDFEIGEKFLVKEDGKVIYSWDAENERAKSAYGSDYHLNSNERAFEYFPVFNAKGETHTVEVTWYEGCTVSYTITFAPKALGEYGDWITRFAVENITDLSLFRDTSEYEAAAAADADYDLEMTSSTGSSATKLQHGKTITVSGAKLPYIDFTEIELEDGYYIALQLTPNDVKQRPVEDQLVIKLDGKEVDVLTGNKILVRLSQANESHKVSVQWNSDVVEQEYTVNFVNNYFLTIEE